MTTNTQRAVKAMRTERRERVLEQIAVEAGFIIIRHTQDQSRPAYLLAHLPEGDGRPACGTSWAADGSDDPKRLPRVMPLVCPDCVLHFDRKPAERLTETELEAMVAKGTEILAS